MFAGPFIEEQVAPDWAGGNRGTQHVENLLEGYEFEVLGS